jgi:hypothetical protein
MDDPAVQAALIEVSQNDMFWAVRERAVQAIGAMESLTSP